MERRTKILATLGPSTSDVRMIKKLVKEGADAFRINFSHGDENQWSEFVKFVREIEGETGKGIPLVGDLQGPNVRLGRIVNETGAIDLRRSGKVIVEYGAESEDALPVPLKAFFEVLEKGDIIVIGDGQVVLEVEEVDMDRAIAKVVVPGKVSSRKSVYVKDKQIPMPFITEKDRNDLIFAVKNNFSYILLSFVESPSHIEKAREFLKSIGGDELGLIAKIETANAVSNIEGIVKASDGVVVARGDLGTHFPLEKLPSIQRRIIRTTRIKGKIGVLATQLLSSMLESPVPSRSDVVDIYNGVLQGADVMMLTNETAVGRYPAEAVSWLRRVIVEAEKELQEHLESQREAVEANTTAERFAKGIVEMANNLSAHIIVYTKSGKTVSLLSRFRPSRTIYAGTSSINVARKIRMLWGVHSLLIKAKDYADGIDETRNILLRDNLIGYGETVIETYRISTGESHHLKIYQVR